MLRFPATDQPGSPEVAALYDDATGSWQYVAWDPDSRKAVIVDPVLDFDPAACATWTANADRLRDLVRTEGLEVVWVLDTHPHADHLSAAHHLAEALNAPQATGEKVLEVQDLWADYYADDDLSRQPQHWARLLKPGDTLQVGACEISVMLSTGHTLASVSFVMGDAVFAHDTLMMPDSGSARADFPGGSTEALWESIQQILALPEHTRVFIGHDYGGDGRDPECMATVGEHKASNKHVKDGTEKADFIQTREARDATLALPDRMLLALQVNLRGGRLPEPDNRGRAVMRVPLNRFAPR